MPVRLDPQQLAVVNHGKGPGIVMAVAGAGKTTAMVHRMARLVKSGVKPDAILATTFTRRAAKEMNVRLVELGVKKVRVGTFHSVCYEILRQDGAKYGGRFRLRGDLPLTQEALAELNLGGEVQVGALKEFISWCKNWLVSPKRAGSLPWAVKQWGRLHDDMEDKTLRAYADGYAAVEAWRKQRRILTFDDILYQAHRCLYKEDAVLKKWQKRYEYVIVDEFQDSNKAQHEVMRMLAAPENNLLVVGDDDQSIYSWRAAVPKFMLEFEKEFNAKVYRMERNYRSLPGIANAANSLIACNTKRLVKTIRPQRQGSKACIHLNIYSSRESEAVMTAKAIRRLMDDGYDYGDMAILYRTNRQSDLFQSALTAHQIPFAVIGGMMLYDYKIIKDLLGYLQYGVSIRKKKPNLNKEDREAFFSIVNSPKRGIGSGFINRVLEEADTQNITMLEALGAVRGNRKQEAGIEDFDTVMSGVRRMIRKKVRPNKILEHIVDAFDYVNAVSNNDEKYRRFAEKKVNQLIENSKAMETTQEFLEYIDRLYIEGGDEEDPDEEAKVKLMTIHKAKGLEFDVVFTPGWNHGTLPHKMSLDLGGREVEEERRLAYVAITRAKDKCFVSFSTEVGDPSEFIEEAELK